MPMRAYQGVPFVCGPDFECKGYFYLDDQVWYILCNEGLQARK